MESSTLNDAELYALMNQLEISQLLGVEPAHLPAPDKSDSDEMLRLGLAQLAERNLITVSGDEVEVGSEMRQLLEIMADPQAIVRTVKTTPDEESWSWHFISGPSIAEFAPAGSGHHRLAKIADLESVAAKVESMLPLVPVPEYIQYQAEVPQEDAHEITSLAGDWDMVPALTIMEAGGLRMAEAKDLFDDLSDYEWWGRVDLMACQAGQITTARRVLAIQGQERSWVAGQKRPGVSTIHIETAQEGEFEAFLAKYWAEIGA